ncbi:MAG: anaerobic sulfatase maturase [Chloroflexi bacterium]|nr:anaerobic sulfatase maturase [Chloroflexota bacterium]
MLALPAFQVMLKPRGAICNLDCSYCYFLSKARLYPDSAFRMSEAVLENFTRQYIAAQTAPEVMFAWQGGEPTLMGFDFFRRAVELQQKYVKPGTRVANTLQTNATTLDDAWCEFFRAHDFLLGVSLDGPRAQHDAYRVDPRGAPTFDRVRRGIELLERHRVEFNILTTVHAANAASPLAVYRFLRDEIGARFIQFIPIVERDNATGFQEGARVTARSVTGKQYGDFLIAIFDEWVRRDVGRVFVQIFDVALGVWLGQRAALCVFAETCGDALALEHNGDLFACDHFVEPRFKLGNLADTPLAALVGSAPQRKFGADKRDTLPRACRECSVRFICNGGCPKDRLRVTRDGEPGLNYLCDGFKAFFAHIDRPMKMMAELIRREHPPAEIVFVLAREQAALEQEIARAGRNDPCPCGSGKKFKQCHGSHR